MKQSLLALLLLSTTPLIAAPQTDAPPKQEPHPYEKYLKKQKEEEPPKPKILYERDPALIKEDKERKARRKQQPTFELFTDTFVEGAEKSSNGTILYLSNGMVFELRSTLTRFDKEHPVQVHRKKKKDAPYEYKLIYKRRSYYPYRLQ